MFILQTNDSTALHLAAAGGHKDVVSVLINNGASATEENAVSSFVFFSSFVSVLKLGNKRE